MPTPPRFQAPEKPQPCIILIGMAAAGKSAVGRKLAELTGYAHLDTDFLIEATYGAPLQAIADTLSKEEFLTVEGEIIRAIKVQRAVISTGGSAVYRPQAMRHLQSLGCLVHLDVPLDTILERIARKPDRGLAIAPGQTIADLFYEREALYRQWADFSVTTGQASVAESAHKVLRAVRHRLHTEQEVY